MSNKCDICGGEWGGEGRAIAYNAEVNGKHYDFARVCRRCTAGYYMAESAEELTDAAGGLFRFAISTLIAVQRMRRTAKRDMVNQVLLKLEAELDD